MSDGGNSNKQNQQPNNNQNDNVNQQDMISSLKQEIQSLQTANTILGQTNDSYKSQLDKLRRDNNRLLDEQKEMEIEYTQIKSELEQLKLQHIDTSKFEQWDFQGIVSWIMSLENGRYKKYKNKLEKSLKEEGVKGSHLKRVNVLHVRGWGIIDFDDKEDLMTEITKLVGKNKSNKKNEYIPPNAAEGIETNYI